MSQPKPVRWAALDLGSNSFHMLIVEEQGNSFTIVERLKEKVQLLGGFSEGRIQAVAFERGLACIQRFAQRLAGVAPQRIRAVGTFALRQANNAADFVTQVGDILGVPLRVISGEREAQMIYQAVNWNGDATCCGQAMVDIGGGSTELAYGQATQASAKLSIPIGCVAYKDRYFAAPGTQSSGYLQAKQAAIEALQAGLRETPDFAVQGAEVQVYGTSGTVESIQTVLRANGWSWDTITAQAMRNLESELVSERWLIDAGLPGLSPDRVDIFPAGAAILQACFEVMGWQELKFVDISLLHGMIYEAFGSSIMNDQRLVEASLQQLAERFEVDLEQAQRVEACALALYDQTDAWWDDQHTDCRRYLSWAARLHELGAHINARHYHRHGAYVLKHADIPGLSDNDRSVVALLIRGHRRSVPGLAFRAFDATLGKTLFRLVALLRIAVILERSHAPAHSPQVVATVAGDTLQLQLSATWLQSHPLSAKELQVEAGQLAGAGSNLGIELQVQTESAG